MTALRGKVLSYDDASARGVISGDDAREYAFTRGDLTLGVRFALPGQEVVFQPEGQAAREVDIQLGVGAERVTKSKWIAIVAALVGGWFGLHKFYLGRVQAGLIMAWYFWTGVPALISVCEWLIYFFKDPDRFYEDYELDERAWF